MHSCNNTYQKRHISSSKLLVPTVGPYKYSKHDIEVSLGKVIENPLHSSDGTFYLGQFREGTTDRHGRGTSLTK